MRKLARSTNESTSRMEMRQGSYASNLTSVTMLHEKMADNGMQFAQSLLQMHEDLNDLAANMDRQRKHLKQEGLNNEKRVKDAESAMEKAKARYDNAAEGYERAKTGDNSGRSFGIKGPKSAEQREEDLLRKAQGADQDYKGKVEAAQLTRRENLETHRPKALMELQELIRECDSALLLQLQKFGILGFFVLTIFADFADVLDSQRQREIDCGRWHGCQPSVGSGQQHSSTAQYARDDSRYRQ